jgi:NAD(P)-dependent dehydrogenase (short-subunit alcohol dehydrogenase family)
MPEIGLFGSEGGAPTHGVPTLSARKGGIVQLTKSLAVAWAPDNIRVNAVAPGWIATPLTQVLHDDLVRTAALLARTPLNRWGQPEDVTGAAVFLCSPAAAFITGIIRDPHVGRVERRAGDDYAVPISPAA